MVGECRLVHPRRTAHLYAALANESSMVGLQSSPSASDLPRTLMLTTCRCLMLSLLAMIWKLRDGDTGSECPRRLRMRYAQNSHNIDKDDIQQFIAMQESFLLFELNSGL